MHRSSMPGHALRAAFISDIHPGSPHCHADELAHFLAGLRCERLYLVGDIVDFWWLKSHRACWGAAHNQVVKQLHRLWRTGTAMIYLPGNHDRPVRRLCGLGLPAMGVRLENGLVHANHGDRVESLTTLVEDAEGGLGLLSHTQETLAKLPPHRTAGVTAPSMGWAA